MKTERIAKSIRILFTLTLLALLALLALPIYGGSAGAEDGYYACLSKENYRLSPANRMTENEGGYLLEDVTMSDADDFYVSDGAGARYYHADDKPLGFEEAGEYRYDLFFSPTGTIPEGFRQTGGKLSYRFHQSDPITVTAGGEEVAMTFNPYETEYDLYYCSALSLEAGDEVVYEEERVSIAEMGVYRLLFTPGSDGKLFDADGKVGKGEEYHAHLYVERAPEYFVRILSSDLIEGESAVEIEGESAYALVRYERNITEREYRSPAFFVGEEGAKATYRLYERTPNGGFSRLDEGIAGTGARVALTDAGWYTLSVKEREAGFEIAGALEPASFGAYYLACASNGYGFNASGAVELNERYVFAQVEPDEAEYQTEYKQYRLSFTLSAEEAKRAEAYYITDGKEGYRNDAEPIRLNESGSYEFLFSPTHTYQRALHYYYLFTAEDDERRELEIESVDDFLAFATKASESADYTEGLNVYLTQDLDFSGVDFYPVGAFAGNFYGGYHTLSNITLKPERGNAIFGLVSQNGRIERLKIAGFQAGDERAEYVGAVGVNYGEIERVTLEGTLEGQRYVGGIAAYNGRTERSAGEVGSTAYHNAIVRGCSVQIKAKGASFVGGAIGYNLGSAENVEIKGEIAGGKSGFSALFALGGVAGYNAGRITDCRNGARVIGGDDSLYIGGIAGLSNGEIYFSTNSGAVDASRYAGGVVGYFGAVGSEEDRNEFFGGVSVEDFFASYFPGDEEGDAEGGFEQAEGAEKAIVYCINRGDVTAFSHAGGILGYSADKDLALRFNASEGGVEVSAGNYAGGIVGLFEEGEIYGSFSVGMVRADGLGNGKYVGGIAGKAGSVTYCMSAATLVGSDYVGGIVGYLAGTGVGNYSNVLLLPASDAESAGAIAGEAEQFDPSLNGFGGALRGNYFVGTAQGGVKGRDYAGQDAAAARLTQDELSAEEMVAPGLVAAFSREVWLGGEGERTYPVLKAFEEAEPFEKYGDEAGFAALFEAHKEDLRASMRAAARPTYIVAFSEWSQDNGDLYKDGALNTDAFEVIASVRVAQGEIPELPALRYATERTEEGEFLYLTDECAYYVSFPAVEGASENAVIYAVYVERLTTLESEDGEALAEGFFPKGTTLSLVSIGNYRRATFLYEGQTRKVSNVVLKVKIDPEKSYRVIGADGKELEQTASGNYLSFSLPADGYFALEEMQTTLPFWAWILIGAGSVGIIVLLALIITFAKRKSKEKKSGSAPAHGAERFE